ncbi:glycogen debranching enzyme [Halomicronema hongdechloris C2206]|uniref:Glycogen debranching enzyme n=1 Tax=Halomicronema hongdechloris C2206 TaxID=1641165 RepID=A0A1Z3HQR3_9CYAN|nr:glycogen debranching protein GlgX [Halomicronema hongdechloris]ASC72467.1 glycogen debranching enzyme [Halomicronema hongdechloris C2206]
MGTAYTHHHTIQPGHSFPLGATVTPEGVNFCVYSKEATAIELLLFADEQADYPSQIIPLDPQHHRTSFYWHVLVPGLGHGQVYAYRAYGVFCPERGHRFDADKVLLDPYSRAVVGHDRYNREAARYPGDNCSQALRGVVVDTSRYDWEGDEPLRIPYATSVIYEMHVGGFTRHPNSGVTAAKRGTFAGVIEKIPYLKQLGITAVELLPIHQFDDQDVPPPRKNYWGYSTIAFFAPHQAYSCRQDPLGPVDEFRDMVKALHQAGIEVILDVVFNHTAEGNHNGPTLSFRGLDNETYYLLQENRADYANYSGCGNTVKASHAVAGRLIIDCLRYWVSEMHVDGFRFDLASVLSRNLYGHPVDDPPILWSIESDPILAGTKLIAEAWDAAGLYQVGSFIGDRFAEWNGPFRDDVRRFVKSDSGSVKPLAERIIGSPDIYQQPGREPNRSIHFVTCHDGFTLTDLVSYTHKHNQANGEDSRDGTDANDSWNCGQEGPTQDPEIEALRQRQIKNCLTILFFSQGTPMLLMGDEVRRSQGGNNNAYCQDNEISWFDWDGLEKHADLLRFTRDLIGLIQRLQIFRITHSLMVTEHWVKQPHIVWHGVNLGQPDWSHDSHSLAFTLRYPAYDEQLHVMLNAFWQPLPFQLPPLRPGDHWHHLVNTAKPPPQDLTLPGQGQAITTPLYEVSCRSAVVVIAQRAQ